ncbi:hypothetical protein FEM48_Zijuj05G0015000 [Ziziphus jujuba var. spinosa]|uniref:Uncharacterized protein n=1 Tax=Ziziphus jujuba var. spinosa TaxID=714518 RepID=A0A978VC07_ZIZJJ|nr:hypothetical protein FEM48_Zijuj05G0015000 [Ziziphus jujuba var. spinosa]
MSIMVLDKLDDCVASHGNDLEALKLRRNATLLPFLALSSKSGFEILVYDRLPKDAEMDTEEDAKDKEIYESRDMATLTIDIANRSSPKDQRNGSSSNAMERLTIRDSQFVNLARIFKKRVFTYLGDRIP